MSPPTGRFVRPAAVAQADDLARIQREAWLARYGLLVPESALPPLAQSQAQWADLVAASAADAADAADAVAGPLVLVATEQDEVVGLLAAAPATDPDLPDRGWQEILEVAIDGAHTGHGHATRLLTAWADLSRAAGVEGGVIWVRSEDDDLRGVVKSSGFAADGAHRTLDLHGDGAITMRMVRLSCVL